MTKTQGAVTPDGSSRPVRKDARREVRISTTDDDLLVEAAGLAGVSVTEFLLDRALADAETLVHRHRIITLDAAAYDRFVAALDDPTPNQAFIDAMRSAPKLQALG